MSFTGSENRAFDIAEKVTSVFSVAGAVFIIITFVVDSRFRKPINRLVFYASWGNLFANVATLISRSGINLGIDSPLCQFQGFLIQWFMPADAFWTFAMACNVYLAFFRQYDGSQLRHQEWKYLLACYGIPFVPSFVFLFISTPDRGKIYGNAVLWCWVSETWNALRIATFYGPVWLVILITMFVYVKVGMVVLRWRKQLLSVDRHSNQVNTTRPEYAMNSFPTSPPPQRNSEVTIFSQAPNGEEHRRQLSVPQSPYYIEEAIPTDHGHGRFASTQDDAFVDRQSTVVNEEPLVKKVDVKKAAMSYFKTALLFFLALLCTWVPSTVNRLYTLFKPNDPRFGLEFSSGFVLPLQGFWNTVIYIVTSFPACKALWGDMMVSLHRGTARPAMIVSPTSLTLSKSPSHSQSHYTRHYPGHSHRTLGSADTNNMRADLVVSFEGKNRIIRSSRFSEEVGHRNHDDGVSVMAGEPDPAFTHAR